MKYWKMDINNYIFHLKYTLQLKYNMCILLFILECFIFQGKNIFIIAKGQFIFPTENFYHINML